MLGIVYRCKSTSTALDSHIAAPVLSSVKYLLGIFFLGSNTLASRLFQPKIQQFAHVFEREYLWRLKR